MADQLVLTCGMTMLLVKTVNLQERTTPKHQEYGRPRSCVLLKKRRCENILYCFKGTCHLNLAGQVCAQYFMAPLVYQGSVPLQDADVSSSCNDTDNEVTTVPRRKGWERVIRVISLLLNRMARINTENFLLEVQVEYREEWLLACHERWSADWGTHVCRHLGFIRLVHHKAVNLTSANVNHSQEFVQVPFGQTAAPEHIWHIRQGCRSGHIVALKCSECGSRSKSSRIIGGRDVSLGRWPWLVSLYLHNKHVCGGSIIAQQWIITAAHCVHK
ncbi:unnamed protein product [Ranitomeya imitator]|uniref:Uncharacterized protein n=1 Tax=Ranitomeya imitator TaxID=111125 RepID=A0ABN9LL98_9NEOB|nr:unnamed protein product [Ranitomeya imitator]